MINFLNSWTQKIIVVIVVCTIIEMILPEGNNKKFIKMISGIYVVFIIVGPIIAKINTKENLNLEKYIDAISSHTVETSVSLDNNKYIEQIYKEKICLDIKNNIKVLGYEVNSIDLEIENEDKESYGNILKIVLDISNNQKKEEKKKEEEKEEGKEKKIEIQPVVIEKKKNKELEEENIKISAEDIELIKEYLMGIYCINKDNIVIRRL